MKENVNKGNSKLNVRNEKEFKIKTTKLLRRSQMKSN